MTSHNQKVLAVGATGYLGGFVAKEFKRCGHYVRALARDPRKPYNFNNHFKTLVSQGEREQNVQA